jgi:hypothetical protein
MTRPGGKFFWSHFGHDSSVVLVNANLLKWDIYAEWFRKMFLHEHITFPGKCCWSHFGHDSSLEENLPWVSLVLLSGIFSLWLNKCHSLHSYSTPSTPRILWEPGKQESKIKLKLIFQSISCLYLPCHLIITFGFLHLESLYTHTVITLEYISVLINKVPLYCYYMHIASLYIWNLNTFSQICIKCVHFFFDDYLIFTTW